MKTIYYIDDSSENYDQFNYLNLVSNSNEVTDVDLALQILIEEYYRINIYFNQLIQQNLILEKELATLKSEIYNGTNQKEDF
jgi:hypothetical protein